MNTPGSDTSPGDVSVLHIPVPDGSCRLIPESDLNDGDGLLLWTRVHARFQLRSGPLELLDRDGPGLLANDEWAQRIEAIIRPKVEALSGTGRRAALNGLARLIYDCPPIVLLEPVALAVSSALAEREVAFLDALAALATRYQHGSGKREKGSARIRPPFVAAWEEVERWRLAHGRHGLAADCGRLAAAKHQGKSITLVEREKARLQRAYLRAQKHPSIKAVVVLQVGCPGHRTAIHPAPAIGPRPHLNRPTNAVGAKALFTTISVGRVEALPPDGAEFGRG